MIFEASAPLSPSFRFHFTQKHSSNRKRVSFPVAMEGKVLRVGSQ